MVTLLLHVHVQVASMHAGAVQQIDSLVEHITNDIATVLCYNLAILAN